MIEAIGQHLLSFWLILGLLLLTIEVAAFGMASGVLLFAGIGALLTGVLMAVGLVPATIPATLATFAIASGLSAILLWKPLKKFQNDVGAQAQASDLIGYQFLLDQDITRSQPGSVRYSGVEWRVEMAPESPVAMLPKGTFVEVVSVDAGVFRVRAVQA